MMSAGLSSGLRRFEVVLELVKPTQLAGALKILLKRAIHDARFGLSKPGIFVPVI